MAIINSEQVEVFNKQLSDKKAADPVLSGASAEALDIAIGQARREVIPKSFGAAMFEIPEGKDPNQYINSITDNIVSTAVVNFKDLSMQNPTYLSGWIQNKPSFKDSKAYNDLKTITKTEFNTIENGISDLESGESADFRNKELNKISSNNLQHILDSTVLNYLKEIGIQRAAGAAPSDGYIMENAKDVFDFLAKSLTPPPPPKPVETPVPPPPKPVEQTPTPAPPTEIPATVTTSQPEITKSVTAAQPEITKPVDAITEAPTATPPAPEQKPSIVQQTQTNVTNITNQAAAEAPKTFGTATTKEFTKEESPLLSMLGDQLGMSAGEIANMFAGADIETFDQAIAQSFGGETSNLTQQADEILQNPDLAAKASTVVEGIAQSENIPPTVKEQVANVVSQKTQINEPVPPAPAPPQEQTPPPPPPQTAPASQEANQEKSQETKAQEEKEKSSSEAETKAAEESKKEEDQKINGELLKTMREILKVLQGPLIVTDNTHKFS